MISFQNLSLNPEYEELRQEVAALQEEIGTLLAEIDRYRLQIIPQVEANYRAQIGVLECKIFEFEIQTRRIKRKLNLIQTAVNREETPDLTAIESRLDEEETDYQKRLEEMQTQIAQALDFQTSASFLSEEDSEKVRQLYFKIVKELHPDLHPDAAENQKRLLKTAMAAYEQGNLTQLEAIQAAIQTIAPIESPESAWDELRQEKDRLIEIQDRLKADFDKMLNSFPCDQIKFLADPAAVERKKAELQEFLEKYQAVYADYENRIKTLLNRLGGQF